MTKKDSASGLILVVNPQWETRGLAFGQSGEGRTLGSQVRESFWAVIWGKGSQGQSSAWF